MLFLGIEKPLKFVLMNCEKLQFPIILIYSSPGVDISKHVLKSLTFTAGINFCVKIDVWNEMRVYM